MALHTIIGSKSVPEGTVRVNKQEALAYQKAVIRDWKNESDVFFLRYGQHLACTSVALTSIITLNHFKLGYQLGKTPGILMSLPTTITPVFLTWSFFDKMVTDKVMLMKSKCPLCHQLSYGMFQVSQGLAYPILAATVSGGILATLFKTCNIPNDNVKKILRFMYSIFKPGALKFQAFGAFHLLAGLLLPYFQTKELINVTKILENIEYDDNLKSYKLNAI